METDNYFFIPQKEINRLPADAFELATNEATNGNPICKYILFEKNCIFYMSECIRTTHGESTYLYRGVLVINPKDIKGKSATNSANGYSFNMKLDFKQLGFGDFKILIL